MTSPAFAELGIATNFSFLHGGSHPQEYVHQASDLFLPIIGIADHNTLAGVVRAYKELENDQLKAPPRLLVGARLVFMDDSPDILVYPSDRAAYGRLCQLLTRGKSNIDAQAPETRIAKGACDLKLSDLLDFAEGQLLIVMPPHRFLAADLQAILARLMPACRGALWLGASLFHRGDDARRLKRLHRLAREANVPLIATNDVLYHHPARRPLQDVLTCIREKTTLNAAGRKLEANAERHLKPAHEMARLFRDYPEALAETMRLAGRVTFSLDDLKYHYPNEPIPPGKTAQQHLEDLTWQGLEHYFPGCDDEKLKATLRKELALVQELNYAHYFLTVHDIVHWARRQKILCQGRGSAANSAVCYVLGITAVNPAEHDVLFERFISKERLEPPDIDVDFEHVRREEVMQYIYDRYGRHRAAIIATVIHYRPRSAIRDVGKVLGLTEDVTAALADTVWGSWGRGLSDLQVEQAGLSPANPTIARAVALASDLIGFPRHLSQHVGGYVLTQDRLDTYVPIGNAAMENRTFIEWDKDDVDALKMMKVDILALGMLTCIRKAFALILEHKGLDYQLSDIKAENPDAPPVFDMLCRGESLGVFQVESRAQMNMLPRMKPRTFYDLVIEVAIVRPGPIQGDMVHPYLKRRAMDPKDIVYPYPKGGNENELRNVLHKTLGVPLFQEQAMRIAMVAAQFSAEEANGLRRAMATFRNVGTIGTFERLMVDRMIARGYDETFAKNCFEQIKGFGSYGFPESHAASFAHLVYVSSWMKHYHPDVFCCALLNSQPMGFYAPAQIVRDARENGVVVRPVDVSYSHSQNGLEEADGARGCRAVRLGFRQIDGFHWRDADEERLKRLKEGRALLNGRALEPGTACSLPSCGGEVERGVTRSQTLKATSLPNAPPQGGREQSQDDWGERIVAARARKPFASLEDFARATQLPKRALMLLADADAFRSLGLDRRAALWAVRRLPDDEALPLFEAADARELADEHAAPLPQMPMAEEVVTDYQTLRLSLKGHPMQFLRAQFAREGVRDCRTVSSTIASGRRMSCAGVVLVRQRPGSAKGVVFLTLEDETGIANVVVWPSVLETFRKEVMGARLVLVHGTIQASKEKVVHLVAERLVDRSFEMGKLSDSLQGARPPLPPGSELYPPLNDDRRDHPAGTAQQVRHPRNVRILPPSRDFH